MPRPKGSPSKNPRTAPKIAEKETKPEAETPKKRVAIEEKATREAPKIVEDKPKEVVFEGQKVVKVLEEGHTKTHLHVAMEGGTTRHVPREIFN